LEKANQHQSPVYTVDVLHHIGRYTDRYEANRCNLSDDGRVYVARIHAIKIAYAVGRLTRFGTDFGQFLVTHSRVLNQVIDAGHTGPWPRQVCTAGARQYDQRFVLGHNAWV
jgi:hypothetical protein